MSNKSFPSQWDKVHSQIATHHAEVQQMIRMTEVTPGSTVLDLACGTGQHLLEFAQLGYRCIGIDQLHWKLVKAATLASNSNLRVILICADLRRPPIIGTFDLIICLYALSNFHRDEDIHAVFSSIKRKLTPKGSFIFNVVNKEANTNPNTPLFQLTKRGYLRDFTLEEISSIALHGNLQLHSLEMRTLSGVNDLDIHICLRHSGA